MAITFNHTIVAAKDRQESADFFTELFGLPTAKEFGPFLAVGLNHGAASTTRRSPPARRSARSTMRSWSPRTNSTGSTDASGARSAALGRSRGSRPGEINHNDGGRGVYFQDPAGHYLEILTRPYGSGTA